MAKKYTADTFEGAVTGTASGNVAKAGDTMTGNLAIENTSAAPKLTIGDTDNTGASQSGASLEMGNRTSNGLTGGSTINLINGSFSQGSIQFRHGNTSTLADPRTMVSSGYTGSTSDYELKFTHYNGSSVDNYTSMRAGYTYFNKPIRIGADAATNELDDYEEGTWTPQIYNSSGYSITYVTQQGKYVKIGRQVFFKLYIKFNALNYFSTSGIIYANLPFASVDTSPAGIADFFPVDNNFTPFGSSANNQHTYKIKCWLTGQTYSTQYKFLLPPTAPTAGMSTAAAAVGNLMASSPQGSFYITGSFYTTV